VCQADADPFQPASFSPCPATWASPAPITRFGRRRVTRFGTNLQRRGARHQLSPEDVVRDYDCETLAKDLTAHLVYGTTAAAERLLSPLTKHPHNG
jgi:hypothetical protein